MSAQTYDHDFLRWTEEQAALLRSNRLHALDRVHLIEALEDMGREQKLALQSAFRNILVHLLKLALSPSDAPRAGWIDEITEFRDQVQARIDSTPSLKHHAPELFDQAWRQASRAAAKSFEAYGERVDVPSSCPFSMEEVMDFDFIPDRMPANRMKP